MVKHLGREDLFGGLVCRRPGGSLPIEEICAIPLAASYSGSVLSLESSPASLVLTATGWMPRVTSFVDRSCDTPPVWWLPLLFAHGMGLARSAMEFDRDLVLCQGRPRHLCCPRSEGGGSPPGLAP